MSKVVAGLSDSVAKKGSVKKSSKGSNNKKAASKVSKIVEATSKQGGENVEAVSGKKRTRTREITVPARYATPASDEEVDDISDNNPSSCSTAIPKSPDGSLLLTEHVSCSYNLYY